MSQRNSLYGFAFACLLFALVEPAIATHSTFTTKQVDNRVTELKLTIPKDRGKNSSTAVFVRCRNNHTDVRFQFLRDFPQDGALSYFFPKKLAEPLSIKATDGRRQVTIHSPTKFLEDWLSAQRFTLNSNAKDLDGTAEFSLSAYDVEGLYKIAAACTWDHLIPAKGDVLKRLDKNTSPLGPDSGSKASS